MKKPKVQIILRRLNRRDENGRIIENEARPYQFEIRVGRAVFFNAWKYATDENSQIYFDRLTEALSGEIETRIEEVTR